MAIVEQPITAEQFFRLPPREQPTELVRGVVIVMNPPGFRHGEVCSNVTGLLREFIRSRGLGRVVCNDAGVVTGRGPDTVRGADVAYYSYERLPAEKSPQGYPDVAPDLVAEVVSPSDRRADVIRKTGEYLAAGVRVALVFDPEDESVHVYFTDKPSGMLTREQDLTLPEVLAEFRAPVAEFYA